MKRVVLMIAKFIAGFLVVLPVAALAGGGWSSTYPLAGGTVSLTNTQANSGWAPVAVLWAFDGATNATLTVQRVSQGHTYLLGLHSVTNGSSALWIPEADYPFAEGDALTVSSTATNGSVQVIRKGD